ncbi:MAG TPA: GDSL-type esterase/lipase family protein, partial [Pirellulales bacterium]|nr:GDSL-type esterase/lipase family protein [Pirellulales bacterium]
HRAAHANHAIAPLDDRPIVCIGDSLTSFGRAGGYPEVLATMISAPVVNLGQPGITSAEALKQLPALRAARPQAVVIELGGHDFLKDSSLLKTRSRAETKQNLVQFITAAQKLNAEVVIIEIPRAFFSDPFAGLERELARQFDLELVADTAIRELVLYSPYAPPGMWTGGPYLSEDGLHPNTRGIELLARHVARALAHLYGPAVLSKKAP